MSIFKDDGIWLSMCAKLAEIAYAEERKAARQL